MEDIVYGLYVTVIGVTVVFTILGILAVTVYLLKYAGPKKPVAKAEKVETVAEKRVEEKINVEPSVDKDTLSMITASIIAFQDVKRRELEKIDLFRKYPGLSKLLYLAGIRYKAYVNISLQGVSKRVLVEEIGPGRYIVVLNGKKHVVAISRRGS